MSSCSTPKRVLGLSDDDAQSIDLDSQPKRVRVETSIASASGSASGLATSCDLPDPRMQDDAMDTEEEESRGLLPLPCPPDARFSMPHVLLPSLPPQSLSQRHEPGDQHMAGFRPGDPNDPICFGMLKDIQARIDPIQNPESLSFDEIVGETDIFASLQLSMQSDRCDILSQGNYIATMNSEAHHALTSIRIGGHPIWTGAIPKSELQQKLITAACETKSNLASRVTFAMSILVYGSRSIGDTLAKQLGRHRLFLQHPDPKPQGVEYHNPQFLFQVGEPCPGRAIILPPMREIPSPRDADGVSSSDVEESNDIRAALESLPQEAFCEEVEIDSNICTKLDSHQQKAVNFIVAREQGHSENKNTLWRLERIHMGQRVYKHIITGSMSSEPTDIRGGIFADEMGLGKTLSMIASIVKSLPRKETIIMNDKSGLAPVISTLVIVPSVPLIQGWIAEIQKHVIPGTLKFYKYHGPSRWISSDPPDIVFSTYATVEADVGNKAGSILNKIHWHRLVLDEAHEIRNSSTKKFKAVDSLSATIRWCMTGTPIQNSLYDLLSLVRFLRVPQLDDASHFQKHIMSGPKTGPRSRRPSYGNLKLLLAAISLGREMSTVFPTLTKSVKTHTVKFSDEEANAYAEISRRSNNKLKAAASTSWKKGETGLVVTSELRLRMFCNTGLLSEFIGEGETSLPTEDVLAMLKQGGQAICSVCNKEILSLDPNGGRDSLEDILDSKSSLKCEECAGLHTRDSRDGAQASSTLNSGGPMEDVQAGGPEQGSDATTYGQRTKRYPSKLLDLLANITQHYSEDKSIVFTFWRQSLDLVGKMFKENHIVFCRVDGQTKATERQTVLEEFRRNPDVRVLLMTLSTGSEGLNNLSVANRIHILEPQWNPAVEKQAIGRALRWGQSKEVFVIRYLVKDSIEQSIRSRQFRKTELSLNASRLEQPPSIPILQAEDLVVK